jgi:pyruvate,water dikinase
MRPLEFDLGLKRFLEGFGWGMEPKQFNYYAFFAINPQPGAAPEAPTPDSVRAAARRWREEVLPEILEHTKRYREADFASMSEGQLATEVERLSDLRYRCGELHTMAIMPHHQGMSLLTQTYKELTGGDDLDAVRLVSGHGNKSFECSEQLWQVSRAAAGIPPVRDRLLAIEEATALDTLVSLRADPGAKPFIEALDAYLDEYGWRSNGSPSAAPWIEDPSVPLMLIRAHLQTEGYDPHEEQRRLIEDREAALKETIASLDESGREQLLDVLDAAVAVAPQLEDHNFYLDQRLYTVPRRLIMEVAARLVAAGALDAPDDVFYLKESELKDAVDGKREGLSDLVAQRKQEFDYWRKQTPPPYVGVAPPGGPPAAPPRRDVDANGDLSGMGVSAGIVRGPARVLRSLDEAPRLRSGDVLVTSVTQPSWTPLFGIARAVVTEVGGMLSHTAVASREFGIPAVVAIDGVTRALRDGQLVEVDGAAGTVRLLS